MSKVCDICGSKTELFVQTVENENGEEHCTQTRNV